MCVCGCSNFDMLILDLPGGVATLRLRSEEGEAMSHFERICFVVQTAFWCIACASHRLSHATFACNFGLGGCPVGMDALCAFDLKVVLGLNLFLSIVRMCMCLHHRAFVLVHLLEIVVSAELHSFWNCLLSVCGVYLCISCACLLEIMLEV